MEQLNLPSVLRQMGGRWASQCAVPNATVSGVSTDSRSVRPGELFVALRGERYDGHDFVEKASSRGVAACVVEEESGVAGFASKVAPLIAVRNSLEALERLAVWNRMSLTPQVTAITGSVGKTTTKEFLRTLLQVRRQVVAAPKSFNNRLGVSLTLLSANRYTRHLVVELGTSASGEISHLSKLVRPDRAVVTKIVPAHLRGLKDLDGVIDAKAEILEGLVPDGVTYLNTDLPGFERFARRAPGEVRTFGWNRGDFAVRKCRWCGRLAAAQNGTRTRPGYFFTIDGEELFLPVLGKHNVINAAAAIAVTRDLDFSWVDIRAGLEACRLPPQRLQYEMAGDVLFIDDSYNANPGSLAAAIEVWDSLPVPEGRKFVVLGDMMELGAESRKLHEQMGTRLARSRVDLLVTVGRESCYLARAFDRELRRRAYAFLPEISHFQGAAEAREFLQSQLRSGDQVLFKGSNQSGVSSVAVELRKWAKDVQKNMV